MEKTGGAALEIEQRDQTKRYPKLCKTNYPVSIAFIVVNEFCERFSYYGMKAVLTLYFINYLHWDKDLSTAVYHGFSSLCYFTPLLGALIADSWLGKFKTIIYLSTVYVIGHVVKSVGAIPDMGNHSVHIALSMTGLVLIAFGTGGIKPCVAAFGGDQFEEEHRDERRRFFSIFYMAINAGSVLSTVITPILRGDVQCFGGDCYALAFGVPAALMVMALVVFLTGSGLYKKSPPQGNILLDVCKCVGFAIKNRWRSSKDAPRRYHWLDWAQDQYSKQLIHDIKLVLRVLMLYIPLPMFWALFDQQGSRWTLQATRMNMDFGYFILKPDQMQMLNALLILVFVPVFDMGLYPLINLCRINMTPLKKMGAGMMCAALAFVAAAVVEVNVNKTVVQTPADGHCQLQVLNLANGSITVTFPAFQNMFPSPIQPYQDPPEYQQLQLKTSQYHVSLLYGSQQAGCVLPLRQHKTYTLILHNTPGGVSCKLVEDHIEKSENGKANLRFVNAHSESLRVSVGGKDFLVPATYGVSQDQIIERGEYGDVTCKSAKQNYTMDLGLLDFGASYTIVLTDSPAGIVPHKMVDVQPNDVHISWQIPQYVLITAGEVMFSITGLEFSYSQAPANMKSVLQAGWLMTVAFGNVIVLIVAEGAGLQQWMEFLLFAGLLVAVCVIFSVMAYFYTYVNTDQLSEGNDNEKKELKDSVYHMELAQLNNKSTCM